MTVQEHVVSGDEEGATLAAVVRGMTPGLSWNRARELCTTGRVRVGGEVETDDARRLRAKDMVHVDPGAPRLRRGVLAADAIVFVDRDVVVVRKPAGMLTVPYEQGDRDTLVDVARAALRKRDRGDRHYDPMLGVVQRLDKDTTGLLVMARTVVAKRHLAQQLRVHSVERRYLAIVHGEARDATHETVLMSNRGDGLRGSWGVWRPARGSPPGDAQRAITHVRVVERLRGATLVECRLETGRQHQIRIHLSEAGTPLVGEQVYIRDYDGPRIQAPRPMLHAWVLGFEHPRTGAPMRFEDPPPRDFEEVAKRLGSKR